MNKPLVLTQRIDQRIVLQMDQPSVDCLVALLEQRQRFVRAVPLRHDLGALIKAVVAMQFGQFGQMRFGLGGFPLPEGNNRQPRQGKQRTLFRA